MATSPAAEGGRRGLAQVSVGPPLRRLHSPPWVWELVEAACWLPVGVGGPSAASSVLRVSGRPRAQASAPAP